MEGQSRKLRNGIHPKTGEKLQQAVELNPVIVSLQGSSQMEQSKPPDGFYVYVPEDLEPVTPTVVAYAPPSTERRLALLDRIRAKELANSQARGDVISDVLSIQFPCSSNIGHVSNGNPAEMDANDASSQAHGSSGGPVMGGGVALSFPR